MRPRPLLLALAAGVVLADTSIVTLALTALLLARGVQALGGAAGLMAAFALLHSVPGRGRRLWVAAAVVATAAGPALGGLLTEAFSWRAIFVAQIPVALLAAGAAALGPD